jgi:hypothetical protein
MNHEEHEEHEVVLCVVTDPAVTFRVHPMADFVLDDPLFFFVFLRALRVEIRFPG